MSEVVVKFDKYKFHIKMVEVLRLERKHTAYKAGFLNQLNYTST